MRLTAFASIRVYAIDGRQWTKSIIVMMLGLVPVAINIVSMYFTVDILVLICAWFTVQRVSSIHVCYYGGLQH